MASGPFNDFRGDKEPSAQISTIDDTASRVPDWTSWPVS